MPAIHPAMASPRARRCCGVAKSWKRAEALRLWGPRSPKTRRRPSSSTLRELNAHLVDQPFQQPLGRRRLKDVWSRQVRWARLRRATFPLFFLPEILTTSLFTLAAAGVAAPQFGVNIVSSVAAMAAFWYGAEAILAVIAGWPLTWRMPLAWIARDFLLPLVFAKAWTGHAIVWRGNAMNVEETMFSEAESEPRPQI